MTGRPQVLAERVEARLRAEWPGTHMTGAHGIIEAPDVREGGATDALIKLAARLVAEEEKRQIVETVELLETMPLHPLPEIEALVAKATPGPWFVKPNDLIGGTCIMPEDRTPGSYTQEEYDAGQRQVAVADFINPADAELIVALRNGLPT